MTSLYSISTIRKRVRKYGELINAPSHLLSIRTTSDGFGAPYIEIDEKGYNYVVSERGTEFERRHSKDFKKVLYWILKDIVFIMASEYEIENRRSDEDFRRILFAKKIELMEKLDHNYAKWLRAELDKILEEHPFEDRK